MEGYLRGYYGYKNFGDELLFFGVIRRLFETYPLTKLFVEVGNKSRMEDWIRENYQGLLTEKQLNAIRLVDTKQQHIHKLFAHIINMLGIGKYKKTFKFFGGGEVLSDERKFPHDGRNIPLLFRYSVKRGQFVVLGGIGKIKKSWTEKLYRYVLPKAEKIIVRDRDSFDVAKHISPENVMLHQDFAQDILQNFKIKSSIFNQKYILININKQMVNKENLKKIVDFCNQYPHHKKIFFPCDMMDDVHCFQTVRHYIPQLENYDRTKHSLQETVSCFYHADGGVGARLHFLLPLKLYGKPLVAIPYADKINKLIIKK